MPRKPRKTARRKQPSPASRRLPAVASGPWRKRALLLSIVAAAATVVGLGVFLWISRLPGLQIDRILALYAEGGDRSQLTIQYPIDGAVFPPEIPPPTFRWEDPQRQSNAWLVTCELDGEDRMTFACYEAEWTPSARQWEAIKRRSAERQAKFTVLGVDRESQDQVLSAGSVSVGTSTDPVGAPIFYREVNLPFLDAVKDPTRIRWRFGSVASAERPRVVLEKMPVCGNCHSFSADGSVLGMDVDYANDKGSYAIAKVAPEITLDGRNVISWSDFRKQDGKQTFGLLSQVSPDGRYVVSTVKDRSVFVGRNDLAYSQLFFPIKGILAVYDRSTKTFRALPGADDPKFVQSNPTWSPDGRSIVFARSEAYELEGDHDGGKVLLDESQCREFLERGKPFRFDLYRIPFNGGDGGVAEPVEGASQNGMSNYFPKFSPDGRWIVFCQAKNYMLLQPDSRLFIIPAEGGQARALRCNTPRMNSWHSWSPNGRWLVFSSKMYSAYTQLFLTHVDQAGRSSPPVLLSQFTAPDRAANIPEFVNVAPDAIQVVRQQFLDDVSYVRAAEALWEGGDLEGAIKACRQALAINPKNLNAICNLGIVHLKQQKPEEALAELTEVVRRDPNHVAGHYNLGMTLTMLGKWDEAEKEYQKVLELRPEDSAAALSLGILQINGGRPAEAAETFAEGIRHYTNGFRLHYYLGLALHRQGLCQQAAESYARAIRHRPDYVRAMLALASIRAADPDPEVRDGQQALSLATRACELTRYSAPAALEVLAAASAECGRFDQAVQAAAKAELCAKTAGDQQAVERIEERIKLYSQGKPLREYDFVFDQFPHPQTP